MYGWLELVSWTLQVVKQRSQPLGKMSGRLEVVKLCTRHCHEAEGEEEERERQEGKEQEKGKGEGNGPGRSEMRIGIT